MRVLDASVVLAWLLRDPIPPAMATLLDDHITGRAPAVAPDLLHHEVANVLARGGGLRPDVAREGYARFVGLEIETFTLVPAEYRRALDLALDRGITVYDGSYLALALALGVPCLTADRRLARRVADLDVVQVVPT